MNKYKIKAYINDDLIPNDDRTIGIEIYQEDTDNVEYEYFKTEEEANLRINKILKLNTSDWSKL